MTRIQREVVSYLVISAFSILMLVWAIPKYTPAWPGYGASPALVPVVSVCVMLVMSVLALLRIVITRNSGKKNAPQETEDSEQSGFTQAGGIDLLHLARFIIPCVLLIVGIDYIGYLPAAFLFMLVIQFVVGKPKIFRSLAVATVAVTVMYIVMRYGFGVPVPGPQLL